MGFSSGFKMEKYQSDGWWVGCRAELGRLLGRLAWVVARGRAHCGVGG